LRPIASSLVLPIALLFACAHKPPVPAPIDQFPSPLIESTRAHGRVAERPLTGRTITIDAGLPKPVSLYIPQSSEAAADVDLVIHFHGSSFLPFQAVETLSRPTSLLRWCLAPVARATSSPSVRRRSFLISSRWSRARAEST